MAYMYLMSASILARYITQNYTNSFFLSKEIVHILIFQSVIFISRKGIANFYQQKCLFILRLQEKKKTSLLVLTHYYYELRHLYARMKMNEEKLAESRPPASHSEKIAHALTSGETFYPQLISFAAKVEGAIVC